MAYNRLSMIHSRVQCLTPQTFVPHTSLIVYNLTGMSTVRNNGRLIGRVGNNPETKTFDNGTKASLSLATSDFYYNDKKEKVETTQWHNIVAWGKTAELIQKYVEKGKEIAIEG